jgi:hypothetical protein
MSALITQLVLFARAHASSERRRCGQDQFGA